MAWWEEHEEGRVLGVYQSPMVREDDPIYAPVAAALRDRCHRWMASEVVRDTDMMYRKARLTAYMVFAVCPGPRWVHSCTRSGSRPAEAATSSARGCA
ncbi:hypothetical protein [Longimycelium tulufanense]